MTFRDEGLSARWREAARQAADATPIGSGFEVREMAAADAAVGVVLEHLRADFEREAQTRYRVNEDGSDWQEAWRRVDLLLMGREGGSDA